LISSFSVIEGTPNKTHADTDEPRKTILCFAASLAHTACTKIFYKIVSGLGHPTFWNNGSLWSRVLLIWSKSMVFMTRTISKQPPLWT